MSPWTRHPTRSRIIRDREPYNPVTCCSISRATLRFEPFVIDHLVDARGRYRLDLDPQFPFAIKLYQLHAGRRHLPDELARAAGDLRAALRRGPVPDGRSHHRLRRRTTCWSSTISSCTGCASSAARAAAR